MRLSPFLGFLKLFVTRIGVRCNKWYQSISGSSWDHVSIPRASVAVWRRSCVNLGAVLVLFMRSCVDLKTTFGLLEESNLDE